MTLKDESCIVPFSLKCPILNGTVGFDEGDSPESRIGDSLCVCSRAEREET